MKKMAATLALVTATVLASSTAQARHYRHYAHSGACDGIHRCICGSTQTRYFGLPRMYNGHNLWQAAEWPRAFPRTSIHVGAVGYQHGGGPTGHVFRVVAYSGGCTATVTDEKGTYDRPICSRGAVFVDVSGRSFAQDTTQTYSAHQRHQQRRNYRVAITTNYMERFGAGI